MDQLLIALVIVSTTGVSIKLWNVSIIWFEPLYLSTFHLGIGWRDKFFISENIDSIWLLCIQCNFYFAFRRCMWKVEPTLHRNRTSKVVVEFFSASDCSVICLKPHTTCISNTTCVISRSIDDVKITTSSPNGEWTQPSLEMIFVHHFVNDIPIFNSC